MNKLIISLALVFTGPYVFASEVYTCSSTQTDFSYTFDVTNGTVEVSDSTGQKGGSADVTYEVGQGEDILYIIKQGDYEYGIINGEEGIRANFSHSIFESNVEDNGLVCERAKKPELESISCEKDSYRVDVGFNTIGGNGSVVKKFPIYTLYHNGIAVSPALNGIELSQEGYEGSFFDAYLWGFEDMQNGTVIAVALPGPESRIVPGTYKDAKADLFVTVGDHVMDGATVDCTVVIK